MTARQDDRFLTPDEAAEFLKMPVATLKHWRTRGGGPQYAKFGQKVRYRLSWLNEWADERAVAS